jgi:hypothetical protein
VSGHAAADPAIPAMKSRRRIAFPMAQDHTKSGIQLRPSKQERASSETGGRCGNVRRTIPSQPRSESGHQLPLRANADRVRYAPYQRILSQAVEMTES